MSKGNPIICFRLGDEDLQILDETVERNNLTRKEEPWTRSSWVRAAIVERLQHQERAKNKKAKPEVKFSLPAKGGSHAKDKDNGGDDDDADSDD